MMNGIHGTTVEIAHKIRETGFQESSVGRAGPGVYFWRYFNNDEYAKYLAYKWWEHSTKAGNYNKIGGNTKCCYVSVTVESDNYIDFSHGLLREIIRNLILEKIKEIKYNQNQKVSEEEIISGLFATFVKQIEKNEGISFDAVITDVPPPKGASGSVGKYIGSCAEAIVVMNLNVINKTEIEESENAY